MLHKKGTTLLEVLVALVIMLVLVTGLATVFSSARAYILHGRLKMAGGELGRYFFSPLQQDVRWDLWQQAISSGTATNCLTSNGSLCDTTSWDDPISHVRYTPAYSVTAVDIDADNPLGHLRRVRLDLNWNEYNPNPSIP